MLCGGDGGRQMRGRAVSSKELNVGEGGGSVGEQPEAMYGGERLLLQFVVDFEAGNGIQSGIGERFVGQSFHLPIGEPRAFVHTFAKDNGVDALEPHLANAKGGAKVLQLYKPLRRNVCLAAYGAIIVLQAEPYFNDLFVFEETRECRGESDQINAEKVGAL